MKKRTKIYTDVQVFYTYRLPQFRTSTSLTERSGIQSRTVKGRLTIILGDNSGRSVELFGRSVSFSLLNNPEGYGSRDAADKFPIVPPSPHHIELPLFGVELRCEDLTVFPTVRVYIPLFLGEDA